MAGKRKSISNSSRFEIFKRDRFTCQYCGRTPPTVILQIDHIVAVASGGTNDDINLLTSCEECNSGKSDRPLNQTIPALAEQMARKVEREEQIEAYNAFLMHVRETEEKQIDAVGRHWFNHFMPKKQKDSWTFTTQNQPTIRRFLKEITFVELLEAVDIAMAKFCPNSREDYYRQERAWKYFCGVCWRKIKRARGEEV